MTQNEHIYAIFCRLEVDDDIISGNYEDTFRCCAGVKVWAAVFSSF